MDMKELCNRAGITVIPEKWDDDGVAVVTLGSLRRLAEQAVLMASQNSAVVKPMLSFELKDCYRRYYDVCATKGQTVCPDTLDEEYTETVWHIDINCKEVPPLRIAFDIQTPYDHEPTPQDLASFLLSQITPAVVMALTQCKTDSFQPPIK